MKDNETHDVSLQVRQSFTKIAPFWPLKNLIAVNPLQGLEDLPIEEALRLGEAYFERCTFPSPMENINRESIKWLQAYCDEGQATITMPGRKQGLYAAFRQLALYDSRLHRDDRQKRKWLQALPENSEAVIAKCLAHLSIAKEEQTPFLTLMLTTLPGWASHIKYRTEWAGLDAKHPHPVTQADYLAMRLVITSLLWPQANALLAWHEQVMSQAETNITTLDEIQTSEKNYRLPLLKTLAKQPLTMPHTPKAQIVFCIDVRSEPFRRALEATGDYQTFGFAGFFGLPVQITDAVTGESYASCPVLLSPQQEIKESPCTRQACEHDRQGYRRITLFKRLYQSVKYTFTTPFALAEILGIWSGAWMALRTLVPQWAAKIKSTLTQSIRKPLDVEPSLDSMALSEQCRYAESALKMIGLTHHFAERIVFCGHGSTTQNNAYATALDCGACGGRQGASNARILAAILNHLDVRKSLAENGIKIPEKTRFMAACHNTTTDEVTLYGDHRGEAVQKLKQDLEKARAINSAVRLSQMETGKSGSAVLRTALRAEDWAQVRPEWGLARNAAFIVAPRELTALLNLEGRCFLHSYDAAADTEASVLTTILTAPMVVAEWINTQYLFSTLNNVAYGGGSKITKNITGKMGIMQGNASDLMTGLPLQSVYSSDRQAYHEPQRLMTVVYAPRQKLDSVIKAAPILKKLFGNGWVQLACIEPENREIYFLNRDFTWENIR